MSLFGPDENVQMFFFCVVCSTILIIMIPSARCSSSFFLLHVRTGCVSETYEEKTNVSLVSEAICNISQVHEIRAENIKQSFHSENRFHLHGVPVVFSDIEAFRLNSY